MSPFLKPAILSPTHPLKLKTKTTLPTIMRAIIALSLHKRNKITCDTAHKFGPLLIFFPFCQKQAKKDKQNCMNENL